MRHGFVKILNLLIGLSILLSFTSCFPIKAKKNKISASSGPDSEGGSGGSDKSDIDGDDPLAPYAWHLKNIGQSSFADSGGKSGQDMKVSNVHDLGYFGHGVRIAVSDTGTEVTHEDLADNAYAPGHRDYSISNSLFWRGGNPYPVEFDAHGTAVAGLISAVADNAIGTKGVAPLSEFSAFLFLGNFNDTATSYEAKTIDQIDGDFDIFNYSYGRIGCFYAPTSPNIVNAYKSGVTQLRDGKGAIYVKSAGNDFIGLNSACYDGDTTPYFGNTNNDENQNNPYVIITAALNADGDVTSYSTPGSGLWISATGGEYGDEKPALISTDITGCTYGMSQSGSTASKFNRGALVLNSSCNYTSIMNGTSSAAPSLSGVIALMLEANPDLSWRDVKHILASTADPIHFSTAAITHPYGPEVIPPGYVYDYNYVVNAAGYRFSNTYGFGRVNALEATLMAAYFEDNLGLFTESTWQSSGANLNIEIPDLSAIGVTHTLNFDTNYKIESVQVKLSLTHSHIGDVGMELISPSGTVSRVIRVTSNLHEQNLADYTLLTNAFYGEFSQGVWKIRLVDGLPGDIGTLDQWRLKINGVLQ